MPESAIRLLVFFNIVGSNIVMEQKVTSTFLYITDLHIQLQFNSLLNQGYLNYCGTLDFTKIDFRDTLFRH